MTLSLPVKALVKLIRDHHLNYNTFRNACHAARMHLSLKPPSGGRKLPKLLPEATLTSYMATVADSGNLQHEILLKLLFYTGVRNAELCSIQIDDIDLPGSRIFIQDGKGSRDRYVLFADSFRSLLRAYLATLPTGQTYLFESKQNRHYSTRRIHQIVVAYGEQIGVKVHPHLFRHQMLTSLKKSGLDDAQIQLISGHSSRKSLEVYTHLGLSDVGPAYQDSMRKVQMP